MNRLDRITAILIQLQSKRVVRAKEIADRFRISLRTVYRDIRTLEEAGIPLVSEAGVGYSLVAGYSLPPVMFTLEEATAFLTAGKLIEKLTDNATGESYKSAMYKVKAVLNAADKNYLEFIDRHIQVFKPSNTVANAINPLHAVHHILKSIVEKRILNIHYSAEHTGTQTVRNIEPIGICFLFNNWQLAAFCHLRDDYRNFRLDRVSEISETKQKFTKAHPLLSSYLAKIAAQRQPQKVVVRIDNEVVKYIGEQKFEFGFIAEKKFAETTEMTFQPRTLEGFARWFITFADQAEIVSPPELKERVKTIVLKILKRKNKQ